MTEIEFVNREVAEAKAAEFVALQNASDESKVEAWFALQAVANEVGPKSNVGVRGLSWCQDGKRKVYKLDAICRDGKVATATGAPSTLREARTVEALDNVLSLFERKIAELGGRVARPQRHHGTRAHLLAALEASEDGREWLAGRRAPGKSLLRMVKVADVYGRDGVNPCASLTSHIVFTSFANRAELVREFPDADSAQGKAMSLRGVGVVIPDTNSLPVQGPSPSRVIRLAVSSGVSRKTARNILRELLEGKSKTKLHRAVDQGAEMIDAMERSYGTR